MALSLKPYGHHRIRAIQLHSGFYSRLHGILGAFKQIPPFKGVKTPFLFQVDFPEWSTYYECS